LAPAAKPDGANQGSNYVSAYSINASTEALTAVVSNGAAELILFRRYEVVR